MSSNPFFEDVCGEAVAGFCHGCTRIQTKAFCSAHIQSDCVQINGTGTVRVGLAADNRAWLKLLKGLGPVQHLTRNPVAVLGAIQTIPSMSFSFGEAIQCDVSGQWLANLSEYAYLHAMREELAVGSLYGFEVSNLDGQVFERIILTDQSHRELFEDFVVAHQSPLNTAANWFPANGARSQAYREKLSARTRWLRARWAVGERTVKRLPTRFLARLLASAAKTGFPVRTKFYHAAGMRHVVWIPCTTGDIPQTNRFLQFFKGDTVGLHLNRQAVSGVWLSSGQCGCCQDNKWSVEVADGNSRIALALQAGERTEETAWCELISASQS